jgi:hypothetical protein
MSILLSATYLATKVNIFNDIIYLRYFSKVPIFKTSGIKTGELCLFEAQGWKI